MPNFSYLGGSPTYGGQSWSATIPTFSDVMGSTPSDLFTLLNSLKQSNAAQNYGFESGLLDKSIGGQKDLAKMGYDSAAGLQAGRIGEQGREFDTSAAITREQEANKYKQLAALLANEKVNEAHDRWLQDQQRWDVLRNSAPSFIKPLPRQPNVNAASFSDRLGYNNDIADWLAQSGMLRGYNNFATPTISHPRRY